MDLVVLFLKQKHRGIWTFLQRPFKTGILSALLQTIHKALGDVSLSLPVLLRFLRVGYIWISLGRRIALWDVLLILASRIGSERCYDCTCLGESGKFASHLSSIFSEYSVDAKRQTMIAIYIVYLTEASS